MKNLIPVILVLAATVGCQDRPEDREFARTGDAAAVHKTQADPMQADRDARDANQTAGRGTSNGMPNTNSRGDGDYAMAASRARAAHAEARQKCDSMTGETRSRCESTAGAGYEAALAAAELDRTPLPNEASLPPIEDTKPLRQQ